MKTLVVSDFSKTFTAPTSKTTWSLFKESGLFPEEYSKRRDELFEIYRPYEIDGNNEKVCEWFQKHLELLTEYEAVSKIPKVIQISEEKGYLLPREGIEKFKSWCEKNGAEIQFVSSGITELIEEFLKNSGFPTTTPTAPIGGLGIIANLILPRDGRTSIATPSDKFHDWKFDRADRIIVLGDAPEDFNISGVEYSKDGKFRGFSFSDEEVYTGVTPLGKNASFVDLINVIDL